MAKILGSVGHNYAFLGTGSSAGVSLSAKPKLCSALRLLLTILIYACERDMDNVQEQ